MGLWVFEILAGGVVLASFCSLFFPFAGEKDNPESESLERISRVASTMRTRQIGTP